jgi:hypothetical protein
MSDLQHQRLADLARELRLSAVPDLYSTIAQSAAAKSPPLPTFSNLNFAKFKPSPVCV